MVDPGKDINMQIGSITASVGQLTVLTNELTEKQTSQLTVLRRIVAGLCIVVIVLLGLFVLSAKTASTANRNTDRIDAQQKVASAQNAVIADQQKTLLALQQRVLGPVSSGLNPLGIVVDAFTINNTFFHLPDVFEVKLTVHVAEPTPVPQLIIAVRDANGVNYDHLVTKYRSIQLTTTPRVVVFHGKLPEGKYTLFIAYDAGGGNYTNFKFEKHITYAAVG